MLRETRAFRAFRADLHAEMWHEQKERADAAERERDAALSAMWGLICVATGLREEVRRASLSELAAELRRLCA